MFSHCPVAAVYTLVNLALICIKRGPKPNHELFEVAAWVPLLGLVTSASFLLGETWNLLSG